MTHIERFVSSLQTTTHSAAGAAAKLIVETRDNPDAEELERRLGTVCPKVSLTVAKVFDSDDPGLARFFVASLHDRAFDPERRRVVDLCHELRLALDLRSVDPLHDARATASDLVSVSASSSGSSGGDPDGCESGGQPADPEWPLAILKAGEAWRLVPGMGSGVLIGQPDTGTADHHYLSFGAIDLRAACNLIERGRLPQDPLPNRGNPGHGTSVASVATGRGRVDPGRRRIRGTAPGATVVPVRCVESVVITDFEVPVLAEAIRTAVDQGCKVVSMSLGGFPVLFAVIEAALRYGAEKGVVFVAAAGNGVRGVPGPASYPGRSYFCSCIAGIDHENKGWNGSLGGAGIVTVSAPAKCVWSAWRGPGDGSNPERTWNSGRGSGTSYATAMVAGLAALWIAHHGHENLFRRYGWHMTKVFHELLQKTAHVPSGWHSYYGAGVADAEKLVLAELPAQPADAMSPDEHLRQRVDALAAAGGTTAAMVSGLDDAFLQAHGRELELHLTNAEFARTAGAAATGASTGPALSESLTAALELAGAGSLLEVLEPLGARCG
jgi:serine protease